jgi:hypothetical protein
MNILLSLLVPFSQLLRALLPGRSDNLILSKPFNITYEYEDYYEWTDPSYFWDVPMNR